MLKKLFIFYPIEMPQSSAVENTVNEVPSANFEPFMIDESL